MTYILQTLDDGQWTDHNVFELIDGQLFDTNPNKNNPNNLPYTVNEDLNTGYLYFPNYDKIHRIIPNNDLFSNLPSELFENISYRLSPPSIKSLKTVSKKYKEIDDPIGDNNKIIKIAKHIYNKGNLKRDLDYFVYNYSEDKDKLMLNFAILGNLKGLKYLIEEAGVNTHVNNDQALRSASFHGKLPVVKYLIEKAGANVHVFNDEALRRASLKGHLPVVKYLIEETDADVHALNDEALKSAASQGHLPVVKYLIEEAGVNVFNSPRLYYNILRIALKNGHRDIMRYLQKHILLVTFVDQIE